MTASGDSLCPSLMDSAYCTGVVDKAPGPVRIPRDIGQVPPCFLASILGGSQPWAPKGKCDLLPRNQCCKAGLFLTERSLPGRQRLHPAPCAGVTVSSQLPPQACPAHLIISQLNNCPAQPCSSIKGGVQVRVTEPPLHPAVLYSLQHIPTSSALSSCSSRNKPSCLASQVCPSGVGVGEAAASVPPLPSPRLSLAPVSPLCLDPGVVVAVALAGSASGVLVEQEAMAAGASTIWGAPRGSP